MTEEENDPILEACLDELLGGRRPPDLTSRILEARESQRSARAAAADPAAVQPSAARPSRAARRSSSSPWISVAVAVGILGVGTVLGLVALRLTAPPGPATPQSIADQAPDRGSTDTNPRDIDVSPDAQVDEPAGDHSPGPQPSSLADVPFGTDAELRMPLESPAPPRVARLPEGEIIASINAALRSAWQAHEVTPAQPVGDEQWCRRVYVRLLGRAPSADELAQFISDSQSDRRHQLLLRLFDQPASRAEFAGHWSEIWTRALIGAGPAARASREGLEQFLRDALLQGETFDEIAVELVTATGAAEPGGAGFNGATNFLLTHLDRRATAATAHTARALLGQRLACAQCHDHPVSDSLTQRRFWELNAFFRQLKATPGTDCVELTDADFLGEQGGDGHQAAVYFDTPSGLRAAYPALPGAGPVPHSGLIAEVHRRRALAAALVQSDQFPRAVVNRCWAAMFGFGFTSPVDDMGHHNPATHPELLNLLGEQFAAHGHDLPALLRWLALSEAFALSSGTAAETLVDVPEFGGRPLFSHFYDVQRWPAATAYDSLAAVAGSRAAGSPGALATTARLDQSLPDALAGGPSELVAPGGELAIMPEPAYQRAFHHGPGGLVERILESQLDRDGKVEHLFWTLLARSPTQREQELIGQLWANRDEQEVLVDIWWALVNNAESAP